MAAPSSTLWKLDPHTAEKHLLLKRYLDAWVPILSHGGFQKAVYIDGFAGPGRYEGGEEGSPLVAMRAVLEQKAPVKTVFWMHLIELSADRADRLEHELTRLHDSYRRPSSIRFRVHRSSFQDAYDVVRQDLGSQSANVPTCAFLDPFGWSGLPYTIVENLLSRPSTEVFINFMFEEINRFLSHRDQIANFDCLFGSEVWRSCLSLAGQPRNACLRTTYEASLRKNAKYVRYFEMRNARDATDYFLFFATNRLEGMKKMKAAMWASDQLGEFRFSDATDPSQAVLFDEPNYRPLRDEVFKRFRGQTVRVEDLESFLIQETAFRETHLRKQVLTPFENERLIAVNAKPERRRGQFPAGTRISFSP